MGLEKAIDSKKEYRKPYRGSKSFDRSCRNNKRCPVCKRNRTHNTTKKLSAFKDLDEYC